MHHDRSVTLLGAAREPSQPIAIRWRRADLDAIALLIEQAVVQRCLELAQERELEGSRAAARRRSDYRQT